MIDTGSSVNLIKAGCLGDIEINKTDTVTLRGISEIPVDTHGSVNLTILGKRGKFYVTNDDIPFAQSGLIGTEFLKEHDASVNYKTEVLHLQNLEVPFHGITIPARTVKQVVLSVANAELAEGYIPLSNPLPGVFFGEAVVTSTHGRSNVLCFNTTERDVSFSIPPIELSEFSTQMPPEEALETTIGAPKTRVFKVSDVNNGNRASQIEQFIRVDHLNTEESAHVRTIIDKNTDRFHLPGDHLECTSAAEHSIHTSDSCPVFTKQYRYPPVHRDEIDKQVKELLRDDIIRHSNSPYNSPLWIVPKKPDSQGRKRWRMVIDFRKLNEKTVGDAYPLPNITEILDQLGSAKYFSTFDLAQGFHQIPMAREDASKTAFSTPYGHYEYTRMPFGLKNAPATFQRLMDSVLMGLQGTELFVYLDDIVVYARSLDEHEAKLARLMNRLRAVNLKLQPDKCEFLRKEVAYLGHVIGEDGVKPDPGKVKAIKEFPAPKNHKNIKQFLGLAGYYRRFIPNFSKLAKPLSDLLKKDKPFVWTTMQDKAFDTLRNALCTEPILQYPRFDEPFILTTDASGYAIGGVLSQGPIGKDLPVAYASRTLSGAELKYSTIEKECLAIVYLVSHFRHYLYGRPFTVITDHKPLVWLDSIKDPSSRLWKWKLKLSEYEFNINYKPGKINNNADALSRNPPEAPAYPLTQNAPDSDSSDESLFTSPAKNQPPSPACARALPSEGTGEIIEARELDEMEPIRTASPPRLSPREPSVEEPSDELTTSVEYPSSSETSEDEAMIQAENIEYEALAPPRQTRLKILETRDTLSARRDNIVIFVTIDGTAYDKGAKELCKAGQFPDYGDLTYERARVINRGSYVVIALPVKLTHHTLITPENIKNCLESLRDVVQELGLASLSVAQTDKFDDISWSYVIKKIKHYLEDRAISLTICKSLIECPPGARRVELIQEKHATPIGGHKGITKTYNRLRQNYFWPTMKKDIQNFIQTCRDCQIKKLTRVKTRQPMVITDTPGAAFDKVSMDIMGPLPLSPSGNLYILSLQDLLTKYAIGIPLKQADSQTIAKAFAENFICIYGAPRSLLTDQGANFYTAIIRNLAKLFKIKHYRTTAYRPQSNGSIERSHHSLTEYLKMYTDATYNWDEHLHTAFFSYNTSVHEGTQYAPYTLVFGRTPRLPSSFPVLEETEEITYQDYLVELYRTITTTQAMARQNLIHAKERSKHYYDQKTNVRAFDQGDQVFLLKEPNRGKLADQYSGPFEILEILPNNNVKINFRGKPRVVHTDKLKPSKQRSRGKGSPNPTGRPES